MKTFNDYINEAKTSSKENIFLQYSFLTYNKLFKRIRKYDGVGFYILYSLGGSGDLPPASSSLPKSIIYCSDDTNFPDLSYSEAYMVTEKDLGKYIQELKTSVEEFSKKFKK